jgi:two-component system, chemotaxis family, CheB/CheR fusion protein
MSPCPDDPAGRGEVIDDASLACDYQTLPVVGLGGSAGSLAALRTFFERMPANSGMAFVVILHLSPEHESLMAEILQRSSAMPVIEVQLEEKVEANRVYVIPPRKNLSLEKGKLRLSDLEPERGKRVAVDLFLRTLAEAQGQNAIGIVLSGADTGGAPGTLSRDDSGRRIRRTATGVFLSRIGGYRVTREVREMVLFALHDLIRDSPFSQLDLISCRNLLIYLNENAQKRALDTFHFGLRADGLLFLGWSESVEEGPRLFTPLNKKHRLYIRRMALSGTLSQPPSLGLGISPRGTDPVPLAKTYVSPEARSLQALYPTWTGPETSLGALHLKLIERMAPPSVVVDREHNVIHLSERGGRYLRFGGGKSTLNLLDLIDPKLRVELRTALYRAGQAAGLVETRKVAVELDGALRSVSLRVCPAQELAPGFFLVVFEEDEPDSSDRVMVRPATEGRLAMDLEEEIDRLKAQYRDTIEQHEASDEEMKASNEELQAMNEELRAASEELETSREELQSINEEVITVNQELKNKVDELGRANSDLQNLMASTNIATVFLDRSLRIKRYTPAAVGLFNLIPSDVGRPLSDLNHELKYDFLVADAQRVLEQLGLVEREVSSAEGNWFLVRLLPYRTIEDQIAGLVLTLVDITERKRAEELLQISEARFRSLVSQSTVGIAQSDATGKFTYVNERYCEMTGRKREELLNDIAMQDITHPDDVASYASLLEKMFTAGEAFVMQKRYIMADASYLWVLENVTPILDAKGRVIGGTAASVDITERKQAEAALEKSRLELEKALRENELVRSKVEAANLAKDNFLAVLSHELRTPLSPVLMATQTLLRQVDLAGPVRKTLEMISRNVKIEAHFIDDLLDLTRISRGKLEITFESMDLHEAMRGAVQICEPEIQAKHRTSVWRIGSWAGDFEGDHRGSWRYVACQERGSWKGSNLYSRAAFISSARRPWSREPITRYERLHL